MFACLLLAALVHPVHETVSEVEWNDQTHRLEVALRLDMLDEQWLRKRNSHDEPTSKWAPRYLRRKFRITEAPKAGQPDDSSYHWIGRHEDGSSVWWYFEIEPKDKQAPTWIEQRFLFEFEENYIHRILILGQTPRKSLNLHARRPKANLTQAKDDPTSKPSDRRSRLDRR